MLTFIILNGAGEDVTASYFINSVFGTLEITPRPLTVSTGSAEKVYDGTPLYGSDALNGLLFEGIVDGERGVAAAVSELTDVGVSENRTTYAIFSGDRETTGNYEISYNFSGTLKITPLAVVIRTATASREYDGTPFVCTDGAEAVNLVSGHTLAVDEERAHEFASVTEVKDVAENVVYYIIKDGAGNPVTDNYTVTYSYGTLTITPREIAVTTATSSDEYDGEAYFDTSVADAQRLLKELGHYLVACDGYSTVTDVNEGEVENAVEYAIYSGEEDISYNYSVTYIYGKISVTPRAITVTTATSSDEYDGEAHFNTNYAKVERLLEDLGHYLKARDGYATVTDVNEGEVENRVEYGIYAGEEDISYNYSVTYIYGSISVTPRAITVTTATSSDEYDGEAHFNTNYAKVERLLEEFGHYLVAADGYATVTDVNEGEVENAVEYAIYAGEEDISYNYSVTYIYGKISVTPRAITVTTATSSDEYDGEAHFNTNYAKVERLLEDLGHYLKARDGYATVTNVYDGEVENTVEYAIYAGEEDISYNYSVTYIYGNISVTPRAITVTTATSSYEYDGKAHFNEGATPSREDGEPPLMPGHKIFVLTHAEITDVGNTENQLDCKIVSETDGRANENYEITYINGKLTVTPRTITVTTATDKWVYDGKLHFNNTVKDVTRLVLNHTVVVDKYTEITDADTVDNKFVCRVIDPDDAEHIVNGNYTIEYVCGKLTVTPREITVTTDDGEWEYDGKIHSNTEYVKVENLLEDSGHALAVDGENYKTITDVGEVENRVAYIVKNADGDDISGNYDIKYICGNLSVYARAITVTTKTVVLTYNGYAQSMTAGWEADRLLKKEFGHKLVADESKFIASVTEVIEGEIENEVHYLVHDADGKDISGNYSITYNYGKISIKPRMYFVQTASGSREYDGTPFTKTDGYKKGGNGVLSDEPFFHQIVVDETKPIDSVTDVIEGKVANRMFFKVLDKDGKDISYNYENFNAWENVYNEPNHPLWGKISVTPRALKITTASDEKVYDGTPLQKLDGFKADRLVLNHEAVLDYSRQAEFAFALNAFDGENGVVKNTLYFKVRPKDSEDEELNERINANYAVTVIEGKLQITKKAVSIITKTHTKVYDGTPLKGLDFGDTEFIGFVQNKFTATNDPQLTNAGSTSNGITYDVYDGDFKTTENYDITYSYGKLEVTARPLVITTGTSLDREYDGTPLTYTGGVTGDNLVGGHTLAADESRKDEFAWVTEVLEEAKDNTVYYLVKDGEKDVTGNYAIEYVWGKINRTPRKIIITTGSAEKVYDGDTLYGDKVDGLTADRLVDGHKVIVVPDTRVASITDVGSAKNVLECTVARGDGTDASHNYEITGYNYGDLKITPRPITITTATAERVYDGKPLTKPVAEANDLVKEHTLKAVTVEVSITDVGDIENHYLFEVYDGERNVTGNYKIDYNYGRLKITPRIINVELNPTPDTVYGTPYAPYEVGLDKYANPDTIGLADGEKLEIASVAYHASGGRVEPKDAGVYEVVCDGLKIVGGRGKITNYEVTQTESYFEIKKLEITVALSVQAGREYNGEYYGFPSNSFTCSGTAYGETLTVGVDYYNGAGAEVTAPLDADTYSIKINSDKCRIDGNIPVTKNYLVIDGGGVDYTISPRQITVTTGGFKNEYNGKPQSLDKAEPEHVTSHGAESALIGGHTLRPARLPDITYVGKIKNEFVCTVWDGEKDVTDNYEITKYTYGTLEIIKRPIIVTVEDKIEEYTGAAVPDGKMSYVSVYGGGASGFINGDDKGAAVYAYRMGGVAVSPIERGIYSVEVSFNSNLVAENYDITFVAGKLEIVSRRVTVTAVARDFEYDGKPLDIALLSFNHVHTTDTDEEGFLNGDENLYTPKYTLTDASGNEYDFGEIIYAGEYTVSVELSSDVLSDGDYTIERYISCTLTVEKRKIYAEATLAKTRIDYTKKLPGASLFGFRDYHGDETGFVNGDGARAAAQYGFECGGNPALPINAGEYAVYVAGFTSADGFIESNYELIVNRELDKKLTVSPLTVVIAPVGKSELFCGQEIRVDSANVLYGGFIGGDVLGNIVCSDHLTPDKPLVLATITGFTVTDAESGEDVRGNYNVIYGYDKDNELLSGFKPTAFQAKLRYEKRSVTVRQAVPEEYRFFKYAGEAITFEADDTMLEVVADGDGLLDGFTVRAVGVKPMQKPGEYKNRIIAQVFDESGNNYVWAYSVTFTDDSPVITVEGITLSYTLGTDISSLPDGYVLNADEYFFSGELLKGDMFELKVENGQIIATVFTEITVGGEVKRRDRSAYYKILQENL